MHFLLTYRKILLAIVGIGTVIFLVGASRLTINFSFEDFYPKDDEEYAYYDAFQKRFSEEQNYIVHLALQSPAEDVFDLSFLPKADSLFRTIRGMEGVDSVVSTFDIPEVRMNGLSVSRKPFLQYQNESRLQRSQDKILRDSSLIGSFITRDLRYLCAYVFTKPEIFDKRQRDILNDNIKDLLDNSGYQFEASGIPYIRTKYVEKIGSELLLFLSMSQILIILVLFLSYRNIWGIIIPIFTVLVAMIWILGMMGSTGQPVNLISNLLIPIMFVVGMSDVIHLMTRYLTEIRAGKDRMTAIKATIREIGFAIFMTSATTAIGFASLLISRVPPIRDFGLYAAIGVLVTFAISIIIMPNILLVVDPQKFLKSGKAIENRAGWNRMMLWIYHLTTRKAGLITAISVAVLIACCIFIPQIPLNNFLIEDIGKNDPIRRSMVFFEENAYGMRPFELGVEMKGEHLLTDQAVLSEMEKVEGFLNSRAEFSPFLSPASLIMQANALSHFNNKRFRTVPDSQKTVDELFALMEINGADEFLNRVMSEDGKHGRISARLPDIGTEAYKELTVELDSFMLTSVDTSKFSVRHTGHAYLTEQNLQYLRSSLLGGLSIAFVVIGILMGVLFRSVKMLLISMVPNVIPLILTGGVMGLFGITLSASTALVFVIAFGIAVDDTIHFLSRYRLERQLGRTVDIALRNTLLGTGKAMIMTSLILLGGFIILLASDFGGTFGVGLFTGLTILFALVADFFLLPVMIRWVDKDD